jgi:hypothetical protein
MAVHAEALTRAALLDAIRARRTYALTGDRIEVEFTVDGAPMGATIAAGREVEVAWRVGGRDELDVVELIQDGAIVHRDHARDRVDAAAALGQPCQLRLEWGWGPWTALALDRITDWRFAVAVEGGRLLRAFPCLQSGPFDEDRRHRLHREGDRRLTVQSYTSRRGAYRENPNQSLVLEIAGGPDTVLRIAMTAPVAAVTTARLADLLAASQPYEVGPFPKETYQWHRLVPLAASAVAGRTRLAVPPGRSYVYLRARQRNGHVAWASPVFLNWAAARPTGRAPGFRG